MNVEEIHVDSDEKGFELHVLTGDACCEWRTVAEMLVGAMHGPYPGTMTRKQAEQAALDAFAKAAKRDDGLLILNVQSVAEELYDQVKSRIGPWLAERDQAKAEYNRRDPYADEDGPWPGESVMSFYQRTGQDGPLRETADLLNKARRENQ